MADLLSNIQLPNLPGYQSRIQGEPRNKKQLFKQIRGDSFLLEPETYTNKQLLTSNSATSLVMPLRSEKKRMGKNTNVLAFRAYFKEPVSDSRMECYRIRKCSIYYYLEDNSIEIIEHKQENSGIPQGKFVKRHRIPKESDSFFSLEDFALDKLITFYGRTFHITDANNSTRKYLEEVCGRDPLPAAIPFPYDVYEADRKAFMSRETGMDPTVSHNILKNPMKIFAEAALGNTVDNSGRQGFQEHGRKVLRFTCVWDDRKKLYGDLLTFKIHYFLADDTCEVLSVYRPNCGRDPFPLLLKRAKLPNKSGGNYFWKDFSIGATINVFSRDLMVIDADKSTREYFEQQGTPLAEKIILTKKQPPRYVREIPPFTGFGSEEDSMVSCVGSLMPVAPKKRYGDPSVLSFLAIMITNKPEDKDREFVVSYYCEDNTVGIKEPPKRNSGIIGGKFLSRIRLKDERGENLTVDKFYIGKTVDLVARNFILLDADDATLRYMEKKVALFPNSDIRTVLGTFREILKEASDSGALAAAFKKYDTSATGYVTDNQFRDVLKEFNALKTYDSYYKMEGISEQAMVTVLRKWGLNKQRAKLEYGPFVSYMKEIFSLY